MLRLLNAQPDDRPDSSGAQLEKSKKRVLEIMSHLRGLLSGTLESGGWSPVRLNRLLSRYRSAPFVVSLREVGFTRRSTVWQLVRAIQHGLPREEFAAVEAITKLAEDNLLDRLQACQCGTWFFAKFAHQRFCSTDCRVRFWENSDERKARKRELARGYYAYHKAHDRR